MNIPLTVRAIRLEEVREVIRLAAEDGNRCLAPTHVWERAGQVVGWASVGAVTFLNGWGHSTEMSDEEAREALRTMEQIAAQQGQTIVVTACPQHCRFRSFMTRDNGYHAGTEDITLFIKRL